MTDGTIMRRFLFILLAFPLLTGFSPVTGPTDLGNEAYNKGNYADALKHYREAAEARPDSPEAHYNLGNAYYRLGEYGKAAREFDEAARLEPDMADAHYNEGDSLYRMQRYEDALKAFGRAKGAYGNTDPDTEHNIELTKKRIEKQKQQQQQQPQQQNKAGGDKQDNQGQSKGMGSSGGSGQSGKSTSAGQGSAGPPQMSNEELKALLDRQAKEEKRLRNYFRPGDKPDGRDRESEIEQMLRGMGFGPMERMRKPGEPYVERDW